MKQTTLEQDYAIKITNLFVKTEGWKSVSEVEQELIKFKEEAIQQRTDDIFEAIDQQIEKETGKKIIRFKEIRKRFGAKIR